MGVGLDPVSLSLRTLARKMDRGLASILRPFKANGSPAEQWARVVMNRETLSLIQGCGPEKLKVLEISGTFWTNRCEFREYKSLYYPGYDVCKEPLSETFDLIIAEQVFEHLAWPYRAARNVYQMLNPGGFFLITTPFLLKVHDYPMDCSRWTPTGLRYLLAEGGFSLEMIESYSWGNRECVRANFNKWQIFRPWHHSLANEPEFPVVVWALAKKDRAPSS